MKGWRGRLLQCRVRRSKGCIMPSRCAFKRPFLLSRSADLRACTFVRAQTTHARARARTHTHTHTHTLTARLCRYAPKGRGSKGLASAARVSTKSTARLPV